MADKDKLIDERPEDAARLYTGELDRDLVFHYSRERRLSRASPRVRSLYDGSPPKRPGLIRSLTSNKSHSLQFLSIVTLMVMLSIFSFVTRDRDALRLGKNTLTLEASEEGGLLYLVIHKRGAKGAYTGELDLTMIGEGETFSTRRVFLTEQKTEEFRFSLPSNGSKLTVLFSWEDRVIRRDIAIRSGE
jgi:hypothetical protein